MKKYGLHENLEVLSFEGLEELHAWLLQHGQTSTGIWVRIFKVRSKVQSVTFHEVLEEGLCFGWSESLRRSYDEVSYLQKFTPRKGKTTQSERNRNLVNKLSAENRMQPQGYIALGLDRQKYKQTICE